MTNNHRILAIVYNRGTEEKEVRLRPTATENQQVFFLLQKLAAKQCLFLRTSFQGIAKLRPFIKKNILKVFLNTNKLKKKLRNYTARNPKNYQGDDSTLFLCDLPIFI